MMKDFLDDALVWAIIAVLIFLVSQTIFKKQRSAKFILGVLLILASVPIAGMVELSTSGCCGAPSSGLKGLGFLAGIIVAAIGLWLILHKSKQSTERKRK